ncbi:O-antigen polymerase [Providencia manganoxydans]|uniref:O-antigen polymerase n=1 Tax=Providencia manganoxydans TaxID=2923283 RepID=UPI0034E3B593
MDLVLYFGILFLSIISIIKIGGIGLKIKMNCSFFLLLWWGYYFWLKIPYFIYNEKYDLDFLYLSLSIVFVYFLGFLSGTFIKVFKLNFFYTTNEFILKTSTRKIVFLFFTLVIIMLFYNYNKYGTLNIVESISSMKENRKEITWGGITVYFSFFVNAFSKIVALLCIALSIKNKNYKIALFMCLIMMLISAQGGSKYALLWLLYPVSIYSLLYKPINAMLLAVPVLILVSLIPIMNIYRDAGHLDVDGNYLLSILLNRSDLFNGIYDLVVHVYEKNDFELGLTIYSLFLRFIPRDIYPDRLGSSDAFMTKEIYNQDFWIFNFGGIGEFYFNFGILGVLFIGVFSGYIIKVINSNLMKSTENNIFLFVCLIASPFWTMPWGIGFNVFFTDLFIFWLLSIPLSYFLIKFMFRFKLK